MELWPNAGTTSGRGTELARAAGIGARKHAGAAPTRPPGAARVHRSAAAWRCATGPQQSPVVRAAAAPWCCGGPWAAERTRRRRGVPPVPPERTRRARGRAVAAYKRAGAHLQRGRGAGQQHRSPGAKHGRHMHLRNATRTASALRQGPGSGGGFAASYASAPSSSRGTHRTRRCAQPPRRVGESAWESRGAAVRRKRGRGPPAAPAHGTHAAPPLYFMVPCQGPRPARRHAARPVSPTICHTGALMRGSERMQRCREKAGDRAAGDSIFPLSGRAEQIWPPRQRRMRMSATAAHTVCVAHRGRAKRQPRSRHMPSFDHDESSGPSARH